MRCLRLFEFKDMNNGWIKLHRKTLYNPIWQKSNYVAIWIFLLLHANFEDKEVIWNNKKTIIKKGSYIGSMRKISSHYGISISTVKYIIDYFVSEHMIEHKPNRRFSLFIIKNWDKYQDIEHCTAHKQNTNETQMKTTKNVKNNKNVKKVIDSRFAQKNLETLIEPIRGGFAPSLITDFLLYWDEPDTKGTPRWKKEKTWDTSRRLRRWCRQQEKWDHQKQSRNELKLVDEKPTHRESKEQINTGLSKISFNKQ